MKKPIFYYTEENSINHQPPCYHHNHQKYQCKPNYHGKINIIGRTVLTVKYINKHGHYQTFDIKDGETYEITAISPTKGICTFTGRIVDFECNKGIEKLIDKPHEITVSALIIDYSNAYESKLLRLYINNIIGIKPIKCFDNEIEYSCPSQHHSHYQYTEQIYDPFET